MRRHAVTLALACAACGQDSAPVIDGAAPDAGPVAEVIHPGVGIGPVTLGVHWDAVRGALGEPPDEPVVLVRLGLARWPALGLEVLFTSAEEATLSDDAVVIGVATTAEPRARASLEEVLGPAPEAYAGLELYPAGITVAYGDDDVADRIAVVAPYALAPTPPAMTPSSSARRDALAVPRGLTPVVDMHLHPGDYATMAMSGKAFVATNLPPFLQPFAPALLDALSDPYAAHVGIHAQTALAGVDHAVLFAVYTQHTTGYFTNEALEAALDDPRNVAADGLPWAWGMASIDFDDWSPEIADARIAALRSYLVRRPDRFIGIKLAHAHQGVALDDPAYLAVYDLAREVGAPVLLHTGFSPFPGTQTDPAYYDPEHLRAVVEAYADVDFVLSHVGQGDARAVTHALDLAATHANVWLELSALGRPLLLDTDGEPVDASDPQYPAVLAEIRARGLIPRTMFASDGPQYSGAVRSYLSRIRDGMEAAGFGDDDIAAVFGGNFMRLFLYG